MSHTLQGSFARTGHLPTTTSPPPTESTRTLPTAWHSHHLHPHYPPPHPHYYHSTTLAHPPTTTTTSATGTLPSPTPSSHDPPHLYHLTGSLPHHHPRPYRKSQARYSRPSSSSSSTLAIDSHGPDRPAIHTRMPLTMGDHAQDNTLVEQQQQAYARSDSGFVDGYPQKGKHSTLLRTVDRLLNELEDCMDELRDDDKDEKEGNGRAAYSNNGEPRSARDSVSRDSVSRDSTGQDAHARRSSRDALVRVSNAGWTHMRTPSFDTVRASHQTHSSSSSSSRTSRLSKSFDLSRPPRSASRASISLSSSSRPSSSAAHSSSRSSVHSSTVSSSPFSPPKTLGTLSTFPNAHHGPVQKQSSSLFKPWKSRYAVLVPPKLYLFKTPHSSELPSIVLDVTPGGTRVSEKGVWVLDVSGRVTLGDGVFVPVTKVERVWRVMLSGREDMVKWLEALRNVGHPERYADYHAEQSVERPSRSVERSRERSVDRHEHRQRRDPSRGRPAHNNNHPPTLYLPPRPRSALSRTPFILEYG
ncbi:uncharacterized protein SPPG_01289 [Spizellomyces punctatus DAOM BR117]|uniref:PH domain-containing protein n=1 Tax=Spizellomyces punctatus (strain DAOM BR117) TaxID=645134 RepID=A0A0L0HRW0_SPIPD|nr:uncharacterized protein SPPG_01289 [Spizellomyces punctatus DAOM BR117]KND03832.1 hypothetical protein SPPG_01289 [Spizellomyces punctatus DAOM BR117]|eukprot:XP_016611871.1 hypothetical protein SPPG_01289 [Spizellomyces punctatus DAOM BR117]